MTQIVENKYGFCDWDFYSDPYLNEDGEEAEGEKYAKIDNLFVHPEFRGLGKGRELLKAAITEIEKSYSGEIKIVPEPKESMVDFEKLCAFYAEMGLSVIAY